MQFTVEDKTVLLDRLKKAQASPDSEFEVNFGGNRVTDESFKRVMNALGAKYNRKVLEPQLDMTPDGSRSPRVTLVSSAIITKFCQGNDLHALADNVLAMNKTDILATHSIQKYGIHVNLRLEKPVTDALDALQHVQKIFRYKQRVTFLAPPFRVDCTVVNQQRTASNSIISSGLLTMEPRFEIEIELIDKKKPHTEAYNDLVDLMFVVYKNIDNSPYPMDMHTKSEVVRGYNALLPKKLGFIGPKPVTFTWENLLQPSEGRVSAITGYSVTDKADGDRVLLYIDKDGKVFMMNSRFEVRFTGHTVPGFANSIFDGEYVDKFKISGSNSVQVQTALFLGFDAYYVKGELVAQGTLSERLALVDALAASCAQNKEAFVQVKKKAFFFTGDPVSDANSSLFECVKNALNQELPYETDGLIFTPIKLAVGANYPNEPANIKGARWTRALKWKPVGLNTIDFLVRLGATAVIDGKTFKQASLIVGSASSSEVNPLMILSGITQPIRYVEKEFASALIPFDTRLQCKNGDAVMNNTIVEFAYSQSDGSKGSKGSEGTDGEWIPLRARHDKTQIYNTTRDITNTANDYNIAHSVMESIMYPVTPEMITGDKAVAYDADEETSVYYMRDTGRSALAMSATIMFHNRWVKEEMLLRKFPGAGKMRLLDLACGKAGDLMKWMRCGYKTVIGVDLVADNLLNATDGAYMRLSKARGRGNEMYAFCQWDLTQPIDTFATTIEDPGLKAITQAVFGLVGKTAVKRDLARMYNVGNEPFDVVSCQFAIHYMCANAETLDRFASVVAQKVKVGGHFVGTCMDGFLVNQALKNGGGRVSSRKDDKLMWMIQSKYKKYSKYGAAIDVYVESINQVLQEFLVDFDNLTSVMGKHGLKLDTTGTFKEAFADMETRGGTQPFVQQIVKDMTDDEKRFSFMNRYFVFVRDSGVAV